MRVEIVPYEPIHAYTIIDRNIREQDIQLSQYPDFEKWAKGWKTQGPSYTLMIDDEVVGCAGVTLLDWKKGEAWALLSSLFYKYKKTTFKAIKTNLEAIIKKHGLRRVQSLVRVDFAPGCRLMEHLGFKNEGRLARYGPNGEDVYMFGRVC